MLKYLNEGDFLKELDHASNRTAFLSSVSTRVQVGKAFGLNAVERKLFGNFMELRPG